MAGTPTSTGTDQRSRILDLARSLMSETGSHAMSMRSLATAADLNVATIYHYFPSKADLLRAAIEERRYPEQLAELTPPADADRAPRERMSQLLRWLLEEGAGEDGVWKLLIGETVRGDATARLEAVGLVEMLDRTLTSWLRDHFPELTANADSAARVIRNQVVACFVEDQMYDGRDRKQRFAERAEDTADLLFPLDTT